MQTKTHDEQNIRILIKTGFCICLLVSLTSLFSICWFVLFFVLAFLGGVTLPRLWGLSFPTKI